MSVWWCPFQWSNQPDQNSIIMTGLSGWGGEGREGEEEEEEGEGGEGED